MRPARSVVAAPGMIAVLLMFGQAQAQSPEPAAQPAGPAQAASAEQAAPPAPVPLVQSEVHTPDPRPPRPVDTTLQTLTYSGFGLAGLGVVVGSVSGIWALSKTSDLRSSCGGTVCKPDRQNDIASAKNFAALSTASFALAIVGAALGVNGLLLWGASSPQEKPAAARLVVRPIVGLGAAGLEGSF